MAIAAGTRVQRGHRVRPARRYPSGEGKHQLFFDFGGAVRFREMEAFFKKAVEDPVVEPVDLGVGKRLYAVQGKPKNGGEIRWYAVLREGSFISPVACVSCSRAGTRNKKPVFGLSLWQKPGVPKNEHNMEIILRRVVSGFKKFFPRPVLSIQLPVGSSLVKVFEKQHFSTRVVRARQADEEHYVLAELDFGSLN